MFKLHGESQESKNLTNFAQNKAQEAQDVIDEIKADLVPVAIKLQQLNNQLDPEDKLDPKNLHTYINAAFVAQLKQHLPDENLKPTLKNKLSQSISNVHNKKTFEYSAEDLQKITDPKEEMKKLTSKIGLEQKILKKVPLLTEQKNAISQVGQELKNIGFKSIDGRPNASPPTLTPGIRPKISLSK